MQRSSCSYALFIHSPSAIFKEGGEFIPPLPLECSTSHDTIKLPPPFCPYPKFPPPPPPPPPPLCQNFCIQTCSPTSTADRCSIWGNCAFNDKSMKFCTQLGNVIRKIFGYRDIADWSRKKNGTHFSKWLPKM